MCKNIKIRLMLHHLWNHFDRTKSEKNTTTRMLKVFLMNSPSSTTLSPSSRARECGSSEDRNATSRMGALLSSYRRGSRFAFDSLAWLLGSRTTAALRLDPRPFFSSRPLSSSPPSSSFEKHDGTTADANHWLEEELLCPCYYTENFFIKKVP